MNLHLDHEVRYMSSLYLMWNALLGASKECCHLGKLIKGSASCSLHGKEYLQILLLPCLPLNSDSLLRRFMKRPCHGRTFLLLFFRKRRASHCFHLTCLIDPVAS